MLLKFGSLEAMSQCNFGSAAQKESWLPAYPGSTVAAEDLDSAAEISSSFWRSLQSAAESKV